MILLLLWILNYFYLIYYILFRFHQLDLFA